MVVMAKERKKSRANYMRKHRKEERELIRIGKYFLLKHPKLVEKELGRIPKLTIRPRPIRTSQIKITQPKVPLLFGEPKKKRRRKK